MARILVLEDEVGFQVVLREFLENAGHRTFLAQSGLFALEMVRLQRFDLLLVDHRMPGMNGTDFLRHVRGEGFRMPAIVMTAYADVPVVVESMRFGVADFLVKPFRLNTLLPLIERCLRQGGAGATAAFEFARDSNGGCHD